MQIPVEVLIDEIVLFTKTYQGLSTKQIQFIQRTLRVLLKTAPFKTGLSALTKGNKSGFYDQKIEQIIWLTAKIKPQNTISEILMDRQGCMTATKLSPCMTRTRGRLSQVGKNQPVTMR